MKAFRPSTSPATGWIRTLLSPDGIYENRPHFWGSKPSILSTGLVVESFTTGTGEDVFSDTIIPLLLAAKTEIILVTCFWARSPSLAKLSAALVELSRKSLTQGLPKIRVRLCFSSRSLSQKLFHTSQRAGQEYPPSKWASKLGLPAPDQVQGLDLQIKSLFFLPFSVLHPKFVVVDRHVAFLPSCNVSWETWLECCLRVSGPSVANLLDFWADMWEAGDYSRLHESGESSLEAVTCSLVPSTLLPSPHHRNPHFRPLFLQAPPPPMTPLNLYLLHAFAAAKSSIDITTPNLNCPPVLSALRDALARGVNVCISTSRRMMVAEQLVTAGTVTEYCVWRLVRHYQKLLRKNHHTSITATLPKVTRDVEGGHQPIGCLNIKYFTAALDRPEVKCHIKCTIIDDSIVVLGSGNMDRASWYTSQELGIALEDEDAVKRIKQTLSQARQGLFEYCYYPRSTADTLNEPGNHIV